MNLRFGITAVAIVLIALCTTLSQMYILGCATEKEEPQLEPELEMLGQPGKPFAEDTFAPPSDLPDDEFKLKPVEKPSKVVEKSLPLKFTTSTRPSAVSVVADGIVNIMYFYDNEEEVGRLTWEDLDGDGELELRWAGIALDKSAEVFIKFLHTSGRFCKCK